MGGMLDKQAMLAYTLDPPSFFTLDRPLPAWVD
jgi:hypothetical protein